MKKQLQPGVEYIRTGLCWDASENCPYDLDISAFLLGADGKVKNDGYFVFYNNPFSPNGALVYGGDNRVGSVEGLAETILVQLSMVPAEVSRIVFCVTFHEDETADRSGVKFGDVKDAVFTANIVSSPYEKDGEPLVSEVLSERFAGSSGIIPFELTRSERTWKCEAVNRPIKGGLLEVCENFGIEVE